MFHENENLQKKSPSGMERLVLQFGFIYWCKLFGSSVGSAIDILIISASLQHNFIVSVPFDTPHESLAGLNTFSDFALCGWNFGFLRFV